MAPEGKPKVQEDKNLISKPKVSTKIIKATKVAIKKSKVEIASDISLTKS